MLSFFAGGLTHLFGDIFFHPLVNYFSGKYNDPDKHERNNSQARHRDFESCMDLHFAADYENELVNSGRLSATLRGLEQFKPEVEQMVSVFYRGNPRPENNIMWRMLSRHAAIQGLFDKSGIRRLMTFAARIIGGHVNALRATMYPKMPSQGFPFFHTSIKYKHPHTGERKDETAGQIMSLATGAAADTIGNFQDSLQNGRAADFLTTRNGVSLDAGCDINLYPEAVHADLSKPILDLCRGI